MFCFKCGKQISDDAVFCQYCGTKQNNTPQLSDQVSVSSGNGELDREALKIYLGNVLSLECIKANYERQISNLQSNIYQHSNSNYWKNYVLRTNRSGRKLYAHFLYANNVLYIGWDKDNFLYYYEGWLGCNWAPVPNDNDIEWLRNLKYWVKYEDDWGGSLTRVLQREEARDAFFNSYKKFKAEAPEIYKKNLETDTNLIQNWQQQVDGMTKELRDAETLLERAYNINIIPSQWRHKIHGIYFLYDFLSTSRESFTTALLHFDLEKIKEKLDEIISQQESIIIQNAVMVAQNDKLVKQNQQQLERLSHIETNTSQAAEYAQIAANNAETCAWISMANYIEAHI